MIPVDVTHTDNSRAAEDFRLTFQNLDKDRIESVSQACSPDARAGSPSSLFQASSDQRRCSSRVYCVRAVPEGILLLSAEQISPFHSPSPLPSY